jgi:CMP-2-keto-3-deoxyoctulosonic acid synthetase
MSLNQFPTQTTPSNLSSMAQTDQNRAVAEVQAAMMIASMNPRNQRGAMDRILNACTRQSLAESAVYQFARGGANVSGASIRLAEAIAQQWGNIQFGIRELEQRTGESTVQAFAWDVETNTRREVTFHVAHELHTRKGVKKLTDPRDIYEMVANQGARRLRGCILAIIPSDVTEAAVAQCERTLVTTADVTPEAIKRLVEAFEAFGVSKEQIELRIQRRLDAVQPAQVANLRKIYASIRDGMSTADEWFEKPAAKSRSVESLIEVEPAQEIEQLPMGNVELPPDPYGEWLGKIEICQTVGDIAKLLNEMPANVKTDLKELVTKRQDDIKAQA